jgi:UDP-N-acetylmuramoyl-L-alanyl-D-glutamate--2,6-diaminopimelate ligase
MDLHDLEALLGPPLVVGRESRTIDDVVVDARTARPGSLFCCIRGFGVDGHEWVPEAIENGAVAVIAERPLDVQVPLYVVPDSREALAVVSDEFWGRPTETLPVVGVTGTSGKTTTAYLVQAILEAAGLLPGLFGTIETRIGTDSSASRTYSPLTFHLQRLFREMLDAGNKSCVMEATSHDSELKRLDRVRYEAMIFTNLGHEHLDFHGSLESYYSAKRRLFLRGTPAAAINIDDRFGRRLAEELRANGNPLLTYGLGEDAEVRAEELVLSERGASFRIGGLELRTSLLGTFNVENALGAAAVARLLGLPDEAIAAGLAALNGVPGRMEPVREGQPFSVYVDFAHKPEALEAVLRTARMLTRGNVISVFGCGGDCYRGKRPMMGRIASDLSDHVILTTDNPRNESPQAIVDEILTGGPAEVELDRRAAIARALALAQPGDVVVVAGRGHEESQSFAGGLQQPFDDREVVRALLRGTSSSGQR